MEIKANEGKKINIEVDGVEYMRIPIKTKLITKDDNLGDVLDEYTKDVRRPGDMIYVSEKIVAISQGRAFPIDEMNPSWLAKFLVKFVYKSPHGIGISSPYTMQLALQDVGLPRILLGCAAAAVTKPFGIRGAFYKVCGYRARAIDGPADGVIPPYNRYAKMAPDKPHQVAREMKERLGNDVIIIDANDLGANILGKSNKNLNDKFLCALFKDNPLCQNSQQTPVAVVRKVEK